MDFLTQQEIKGFKQDIQNGSVKQSAEKFIFEKKLLEGLGEQMIEDLNNPNSESSAKNKKIARKFNRKKRWAIFKENLKAIFVGKKKETV